MEYTDQYRDQIEARRELSLREEGGILVVLYWLKRLNILSLYLEDDDQTCEFNVPNDRGLDAFYHPYAYAGHQGLLKEKLTQAD